MRHFNYTLTPTAINNAKKKEKPYKLTDGGGLYVAVAPSGKKTWRYQYALDGKRPEVTIGGYPEIGVAEARERHAEYRALIEKGIDPAKHKQEEKRNDLCGHVYVANLEVVRSVVQSALSNPEVNIPLSPRARLAGTVRP